MLLKEIFSKKKPLFRDILSKKLLNQTTYEKSYIRRALSESTPVVYLDNCRNFFNTIKKERKKARKKERKSYNFVIDGPKQKSYGKKPIFFKSIKKLVTPYKKRRVQTKLSGYLGYFSYTTTFLYRNRKVKLISFRQPICNIVSLNFIDLFLKGLKTLLKGRIKGPLKKQSDTLIILEVLRGGFNCYSYGFRGFLTTVDFKYIVKKWKKEIGRRVVKTSGLFILRSLIKSQSFQWSISSPPRFKFDIETVSQTYRFRDNKFTLSRKKRTEIPTKMLPDLVFRPFCKKSLPRRYTTKIVKLIFAAEKKEKIYVEKRKNKKIQRQLKFSSPE